MTSLLEKQFIFTQNLAKLIQFINSGIYRCKVTEVFRTLEQAELNAKKGVGIKNSLHCDNLAADVYLFIPNSLVNHYKMIDDFDRYKYIGEYWESLHPNNRWGGNFKNVDCVHFEMQNI